MRTFVSSTIVVTTCSALPGLSFAITDPIGDQFGEKPWAFYAFTLNLYSPPATTLVSTINSVAKDGEVSPFRSNQSLSEAPPVDLSH